jgi:beta-glucosidase
MKAISTNRFPADFRWGAATAAYQIEGGAKADGRGPSIWDEFCAVPGNTVNGESGAVACDHFHRWREDLDLMASLGLRNYRLSVSWPRIMPNGRGAINPRGMDFYRRLIDGLLERGITPMVTLYHWDLPAALQSELGGWLNDDLPLLFSDYASAVFEKLGDAVPLWLTLNEPWVVVDAGYFHGVHPPGIEDRAKGYRAGHNLMRAHAYAVARYRASRWNSGKISFALNSSFSIPATSDRRDVEAAERAVQNFAGWFGDPAIRGDYPAVMRERLGELLPTFNDDDSRLLKGSCDYLALNYYTSEVVRHASQGPMEYEVLPQPGTPRTQMDWPIRPDGLTRLLLWLHKRYEGLPIYITENGAAMPDRPDHNDVVQDEDRVAYLRDHLLACLEAMQLGVPLAGYYVWSLMDNLEWSAGFSKRFGIVRCDFATLKRTVKASGWWYAAVMADGNPDRGLV